MLTDEKVELKKKRADLAADLVAAETAADHARQLLRCLDGLPGWLGRRPAGAEGA